MHVSILFVAHTFEQSNLNSCLFNTELAEVLWDMVLKQALIQKGWVGGVALWAIFSFWAILTVGILVLMEGLSAFLHTLRLHWYVKMTLKKLFLFSSLAQILIAYLFHLFQG